MMKHRMKILSATAVLALGVSSAGAHFRLVEPQSWLVHDERGDPQKLAPCGGTSADPGTPSNIINRVQGGQPMRIEIQETIFHPGHYRVALAVNSREELPPDPEVTMQQTENGPRSLSAAIQDPPQIPVLADGILPRTAPPAQLLETFVDIPNINCEKCTLQVIQFMAGHPGVRDGGFSYHHCADLQITADPSQPIDTRWPGQTE